MDPTTLYRLGQIQQQEYLQAAEHQRLSTFVRLTPTLWAHIRARLSAPRPTVEYAGTLAAHKDVVVLSR